MEEFNTIKQCKSTWFVSDDDYEKIISQNKNVEIENHTFEIRNYKTDKVYVHSFATGVNVKPISQFVKKKIEYDDTLCSELYESGYRCGDISQYETSITEEQFEQWLKDNHCAEYIKQSQDDDYNIYNKDKVNLNDLKDFLIQPDEPINNPFSEYVKSHGNFMKKKCKNTYYAYDTKYGDYCILHLICGETKYNVWTKDSQTKVYAVQKYCYNSETGKVNKLFILGKPHVEVFKGENDCNKVICVESFVKAFTLWNSLKKQYTIITTHSKYIKDTDLRWINENFKDYDLGILCDTDVETLDIVSKVRSKYTYYKEKNIKSIFGIIGNKYDKDINDSSRVALNMCKKYFENIEKLKELKIKI